MYKMEVDKILSHSAYALPVGGVLILAILVFAFGFQSVAEPTFEKASGEGKKKKQPKQKQTKKTLIGNGSTSPVTQAGAKKTGASTTVQQKSSPVKTAAKKESPKKTPKLEQQLEVTTKADKKNVESKSFKKEPKPADFDEGEWQAVNKKEKKKRVDGASANASPAPSPSHQATKKADKKKEELKETNKLTEPVVPKETTPSLPVAQQPEESKAPETVSLPAKETGKEKNAAAKKPVDVPKVGSDAGKKESKAVAETPIVEPNAKKEKNNNNAAKPSKANDKPVEEKTPDAIIPPAEEDDGQWQENKVNKKKKKARRE